MFNHRHILAVIDDSENNQLAIEKAATLAVASQSKVTFIKITYQPDLALMVDDIGSIHRYIEQQSSQLTSLIQHYTLPMPYQIEVIWERDKAHAIDEFCNTHPVDMIVKSTHVHNLLERTILRHLDWDLIRLNKYPLLLVKQQSWHNELRIISCVDPMHATDATPQRLDQDIIRFAQACANLLDAPHDVLHAYDPTPMMMYMEQPAIDSERINKQIQDNHQQQLNALMTYFNLPIEQAKLIQGAATYVLPDYINAQQGGLVVLGGVCRHGLERLIIGNTAEKILDDIAADLLIVPAN